MNARVNPKVMASAFRLAESATACLLEEARLSPKPGLVDSRGSGAHSDMTLAHFERSAQALAPAFRAIALESWQRQPDGVLRAKLGRLGRHAESVMFKATGGVNTHRGAIWALGLLVSAAAMQRGKGSIEAVTACAATLAKLPDPAEPPAFSKGRQVSQRYGVKGAKQEAQAAFPHVTQLALPQLWSSRAAGASEDEARIDALLAIMVSLPDTCVLSRSGEAGLLAMQGGAKAVLAAGGSRTDAGKKALAQLERKLLALNASPGGAADLLAAALYLDRTTPGNPGQSI